MPKLRHSELFAPMSGAVVRLVRKKTGMNQTEFWRGVGMTQSGGSRYETRLRSMPKPVRTLIRLRHLLVRSMENNREGRAAANRILKFIRELKNGYGE